MTLETFASQFPKATILDEVGNPYLHRYFVFRSTRLGIFLHHIVASDPDRALHDHPWAWARSRILRGGYMEERLRSLNPYKTYNKFYWQGDWNRLRGGTFHRLQLMPQIATTCWSLFIRGPRVKPWGFMYPDGQYEAYTGPRTEDLIYGRLS